MEPKSGEIEDVRAVWSIVRDDELSGLRSGSRDDHFNCERNRKEPRRQCLQERRGAEAKWIADRRRRIDGSTCESQGAGSHVGPAVGTADDCGVSNRTEVESCGTDL